jgi:hypothetical protein
MGSFAECTTFAWVGNAWMDNRIAYMDQVPLLGLRALGYATLIQVTWIYDRAIDIDGLRRFQRNLGYGLLGRRIERSPLPFARDRWVLDRGPKDPEEIDIAATARARADISGWADERANLPIDPEFGPGWHLGVLPLDDGGSAVSLVVSHGVSDGVGLCLAIADAAEGRRRNLGYPPPGARTLTRAALQDARGTVAEVPALARALAAAVRLARRQRQDLASSVAAPRFPPAPGADQPAALPILTAYLDAAEWDSRARSLGGTSNSLFAGLASRLGVRMGRVGDDGAITLSFPISERTEGDTRANALVRARVTIDPTGAASDLGEVRRTIKQALSEQAANSAEFLAPLPIAAITPRWVARRTANLAQGTAERPVTCSNLGDLDPAANRPDGTDAAAMSIRMIEPGITKGRLDVMGGQLYLLLGRVREKMFFTISAYPVGAENSINELRELASRTFAEFGLTAKID